MVETDAGSRVLLKGFGEEVWFARLQGVANLQQKVR